LKALFLLLNAAKLGKVLMTSATMLVSVFAYALVFGWPYAAGFVGLIFCHEMGHYVAARQRGLDVGAPMFIPFVGAWIALKETPPDVETEAYVGMAGPLVGTLAALICYFLARHTGSPLLLALAYAGFFLNLFNLIPLSPLDGGRVTAALSPRIWLVGVPILVAAFMYRPSPLLVLVGLMAAPQVFKAWNFNPQAPENADYYRISGESRATYAACYLGLAAFLAIMSHDVHTMLGSLNVTGRH
jgi:Zn-dependent protease